MKSPIMANEKGKHLHVLPRDGGWIVRSDASDRATSVHKTQRSAVTAARKIARDRQGDLIGHGRDGRVRERDTYSSEPLPPKTPRDVLFPTGLSKTRQKRIREVVRDVIRESRAGKKA